jgi:hypothetical protein
VVQPLKAPPSSWHWKLLPGVLLVKVKVASGLLLSAGGAPVSVVSGGAASQIGVAMSAWISSGLSAWS